MRKILKDFGERVGIRAFYYEVPAHSNSIFYSLGGITMVSIIILFISGIILSQFYNPALEQANRSVHYIAENLLLGWFVRGIHFWAVQVVTVSVILHMIRIFITASFKKPRELNWIIGVLLLSVLFGFIFTGTVLKWDQEAVEALEHHLWVVNKLGPIGIWLGKGLTETVSMLGRLYALHISFMPLMLVFLIMLHLFLIKIHALSPLPWQKEGEGTKILFIEHLKKLGLYGLGTFLIILLLTLTIEPPLGSEPVMGIEITKPPWMFLWLYSLENMWMPFLIIAPLLIFLLLFLVPFIDRGEERGPFKRKISMVILIISILIFIGLIINGAITSVTHTM